MAAAITALAEIVGTRSISLGPGKLILFPIIWAILLGGALSFQRIRPVSAELQRKALDLVSVGIMVFLVLVGVTVGGSLTELKDVTWVLALQEVAHLFGTVILALPVAVVLRMGRASIGATYSIDREANLAYTAERYGAASSEYRGTLGVYVFGSVFGALYLTVLAGYLGSIGWLHPLALAMGAGVGSGSMMAAASAAIATSHPGMESQILAFASASNLMTQTIGTFVTCFVALPLAERMYRWWCRLFRVRERLVADGPLVAAGTGGGRNPATPEAAGRTPAASEVSVTKDLRRMPVVLLVFVVLMGLANTISTGKISMQTVLALVLLALVTYGAFALSKIAPRIPVLATTVVTGILVAAPFSPVSGLVAELVSGISFLSLVTPVLALAGLSLGKERAALKRLSWRVVLVALTSFTATFLLAAVVADLFVR
ncbi:DUF3100 domain-containing protein [Amycolatopsis rubida]|uniref:DUF3100 domain-containing protein n=1 Tax=Amycolatopsis rubida TaxID=112413 RepID=A0ABX0BQQ6_9PSEU|nr:DUF3100 domain-containing protein [Amycolatopsis rubida]NEC57964.1 DUF3100 domain-containing protein [Amycolatopsis rubida]